MSEKSRGNNVGDTSSSLSSSSSRIVKNPLLSASVTGLTFDDFQHKPLLLPAAPPIIPTPIVESNLEKGSKSTVSDVDDSDTFSEINLNTIPDEDISQSGDLINNNLQQESSTTDESILSQAASSFSQLPTVASSVLSSFSKVIKDYSPNANNTRENSSERETPKLETTSEIQTVPQFYVPSYTESAFENQPIPEPPKFYSPLEIAQAPTSGSSVPPPPTSGQQNTYRLSAKKKTYAQIPGITTAISTGVQNQQQQQQQQLPNQYPQAPNFPSQRYDFTSSNRPEFSAVSESLSSTQRSEERKGGGLFSFANFVPPVLQNLSGLVQSSSKQTEDDSQQSNVIVPDLKPIYSSPEIKSQGSNIPVVPQFYNPSNAANNLLPPPPPPLSSSTGSEKPVENTQPNIVQLFNPQDLYKSTQISTASEDTSANTGNTVNFFASSIPKQDFGTPASFPPPPPPAAFENRPPQQREQNILPVSEQSPLSQPQFFSPQQFTGNENPSDKSDFKTSSSGSNIISSPPLTSSVQQSIQPPLAKPPTNIGGNTFRLQKGTRLYKSPFSSLNTSCAPLTSTAESYPTAVPQTSNIPSTLSTSEKLPALPSTIFNPFQQQKDTGVDQQQTFSIYKPEASVPLQIPNENVISTDITTPPGFQNVENLKNLPPPPPKIFNPTQEAAQQDVTVSQQQTSFFTPNFFSSRTSQGSNFTPSPTASYSEDIIQSTLSSPPFKILNPVQQLSQNVRVEQPQIPSPSSTDTHSIQETNQTGEEICKKEPKVLNEQKTASNYSILENRDNLTSSRKVPTPSAPSVEDLTKEQTPNEFCPSSLVDHHQSETRNLRKTFESVRTRQHINPFEPRDISTPIAQLSPLISSTPSTIHFNVDSNQNQLNPPPVVDFFGNTPANHTESTNTTVVSQNIIKSENNNDNSISKTFETENQPQIFSLTNYFSNQVNNSLPQQQQLFTTNLNTVSTSPAATGIPHPPSSSVGSGISNYFTVNQPVISQSTVDPQEKQQQQQHSKQENLNVLPTPPLAFQAPPPLPDPLSFFDSFHNSTEPPIASTETNSFVNNSNTVEDPNSLRIQNFFNNPPQNISDSVSELNYKLVGSGIINKRLENLTVIENNEEARTISPFSNIVEPPSSSCSEFSSDFSQQQQQQQQQLQQLQQQQQQQPTQQQQLSEYLSKLPHDELPDEIIEQLKMSNLNEENSIKAMTNVAYRPVTKHWFYNRSTSNKPNWMPFSQQDSDALEENYLLQNGQGIVPVEGGRYDVNIKERKRIAVYWQSEPTEVRRCSWFYKSVDSKYVPYEEAIADKLEEEYRQASISGEWRRKVSLPSGENVTFHGPNVMVHFHHPQGADAWGGTSTTPARPRVVKRDIDDFNIEPGESSKVDHLLLMVHGIGSACDLRFRSLEEVVDEFRSIATQLIQSHYKTSCDIGDAKRIEVLPVSWHSELHSKESGIDERLKAITLESIPKLRNFTNDTLVDVLFYTSPVFCQNIISTVCTAMNSIYMKYCQRNPDFKGGVSLAGHSLGSLILFDLLCHQNPVDNIELQNSENPDQMLLPITSNAQSNHTEQISYTVGPAGTGQPFISYPQLIFQPKKFFALGSPIGMFVTIRGIDTLGLDFKLPTCPGFYNIFHPYDPVAYRIEALVNPNLSSARPVLIPHHKGRKRMHLELKETMTRVSADLKQKLVDTFKNTFDSVYYLTTRNKQSDPQEIQKEVDKVLDEHLKAGETTNMRSRSTSTSSDPDFSEIDLPLGKLNNSRRIDYVLQEAPLEFFNEYLFALTSHVCYWDSEDTILFIVKEIYSLLGLNPDSQVPQQTMTIERPSSRKGSSNSNQDGPSSSK